MIYLIQSGNYLKIGYTTNIENRMKQYQTCNPDVFLIKIIDGEYPYENYLHKKFNKYLFKNEWFFYNKSIVDYFLNYEVKASYPDIFFLKKEFTSQCDFYSKLNEYDILSLEDTVVFLYMYMDALKNNNRHNWGYTTQLSIRIKNEIAQLLKMDIERINGIINKFLKRGIIIKHNHYRGVSEINNQLIRFMQTSGELENIFNTLHCEHNINLKFMEL